MGISKDELFEQLKPKIRIMYSEEGLPKIEIARRLGVGRERLGKKINEWGFPFNVNGVVYPKKETLEFIEKNKESIIFLFDNNFSVSEIGRRLGVYRGVIFRTCVMHDPDIAAAYHAAMHRAHQRAKDYITHMVTKSAYQYDFEDLEGEEWKQIEDYPGYYISNMGRVKHYASKYKMFHLVALNYTGNNGRRVYASLYGKKGRVNRIVSRMVANYFVPGKLHEDDEVNHIDGDSTNNVYTNLEWTTPGDNKKSL